MIKQGLRSKPVKFIVVGLWNTAVGYGLFVILVTRNRHLGTHYVWALLVCQVVSILNAYLCYKFIVFKSEKHSWSESSRFLVIYALNFVANLILLPILVDVVKMPPVLSQGIVVLILAFSNYLGHNYFTFRKPVAMNDFKKLH